MVQLKSLSLLAAASSIAHAGTTPKACNPLKATSCSPDRALGTSIAEDFTDKSGWFPYTMGGGLVNYTDSGLSMTLDKRYDNPTLQSDFYIMYGKVEVEMKAGPGRGVVSSFYLQSDDLDELDIEWVGSDNTQFQSNYFSKGNTTTYDRGQFHGVDAPVDKFHNYTLDWNLDKSTWSLDGQVVRTLTNDSSEGYPQTPMFIKMGIWAGGDPDNAAGTIEWAGGTIDYSQAPYTMYVKRVVVTDYSSGNQYSYNGQSGSWESIEAKDGQVLGRTSQANQDYDILNNGGHISSATPRSITSASSSSTSASSSSKSSSTSSSSAPKSSSSSTSASSSSSSAPKSSSTSESSSSKSQSSSQSSSHSTSDSKSSTSGSSTQSHSSASKTSSEQSSTSESRSTLKPSSTSASDSQASSSASGTAAAGSDASSTSAKSSESASASTSASESASSSFGTSQAPMKTATNVAAVASFSVNSLPFFGAVLALLL